MWLAHPGGADRGTDGGADCGTDGGADRGTDGGDDHGGRASGAAGHVVQHGGFGRTPDKLAMVADG
jgi:hypothetical protein